MNKEKRISGHNVPDLVHVLTGQTRSPPPVWFMRQAGRYLPEYRELRRQAGDFLSLCYTPALASEVTMQPIRRFDLDAAILFADILLIPDAMNRGLRFESGKGPILTPLRGKDEVLELTRTGIDAHLAPVFETLKSVRQQLPREKALIGFAGAPWTVATYMIEGGSSRTFLRALDWAGDGDGSGLDALIEILTQATVDYLGRQIEAGADVIQIFDSWAGVLPDPLLDVYAIGPMRRLVQALGEQYPGVPVIAFPKNIGPRFAGYVEQTGVAGISIDDGIDPAWAADRLQPLCAVQGNLSPEIVVKGGREMLNRARVILDALDDGPFIFNLGHGIVPETPPEHVAALTDFIRDYRS